jgi:L-amino acid N-acyltransferase YncA
MPTCIIRPASIADAGRVAEIYNIGIAERGATFETAPRTELDMAERIPGVARHPMLVAECADLVVGWAAISVYRPRACYAGVGEFSIYIDPAARGQGIGRQLLSALIEEAASLGYWKLLSRIFPFNTASRALCLACGFREVGVYAKHAQLDGRWLDVVIVERLIPENQPESEDAAS